jgi:hypothetical protein
MPSYGVGVKLCARLAEAFMEFEQEIAGPAMAFVDEVVSGNKTIKLRRKP